MKKPALEKWHAMVENQNPDGLADLLADDVVFYSPVVHTPQQGKQVTTLYLRAAFHVLFNDSFHYVREIVGEYDAVLEFQVELDGIEVNGVDLLKWNDDDQLIEFKVMLRPLKAINLIHRKMGEMLEASR